MTTARRAVGCDYPLDLLTDFHDTMELIVKPAVKMTTADIAPEYLAQLPSHLSKASLQWRRVENTSFQTVIAGIDADRLAKVEAVRRALDALRLALNSEDPAEILPAAKGLKPPFAKLYMSFGDFSP